MPVVLTVVPDDGEIPDSPGAIEDMAGVRAMSYELERPWYYLQFPLGQSVLAGGLTLMLVILRVMIISSEEALRAVPASLRSGSLAMGATAGRPPRGHPAAAIPMIMTDARPRDEPGDREAAPILVLGVALFITDVPSNLMDNFTVLPMQIYHWTNSWRKTSERWRHRASSSSWRRSWRSTPWPS